MSAQRFNPLTYANRLESKGMSKELAEEIAQQQVELINSDLFNKSDGLILKQDLLCELKNMEIRLYKFMFGMFVAFGVINHFIK